MKSIYSFPTMLLTSVMILTIVMLSGCTEPARPAPGKYETTKTSTDANGTVHKTNNKTNIYYDKNGKLHGTVDKETTTDPKGLMNKSTTESHDTIK